MISVGLYPGNRLIMVSSNGMLDRDRMKGILGAKYQKGIGWTAPLEWPTVLTLLTDFKGEIETTKEFNDWYAEYIRDVVQPLNDLRNKLDPEELEEGNPEFGFQQVGSQYLAIAGQAMLNDEAGTGKTIQTIHAWQNIMKSGGNPFPALVVCPTNMVYKWKDEINQWWPGVTVECVSGSSESREKALRTSAHVYVINYENVARHSRLAPYGSIRLTRCNRCDPNSAITSVARCEVHRKELNQIPLMSVVVDEAHRIKDPQAKQTRAIWALGEEAHYRFALTGTPVGKSPADVWSALHFIKPDVFTSRVAFIDRFCNTFINFFGRMEIKGLRPQNKKMFYQMMNIMSRRVKKSQVLKQLPPKVNSVRWIDLGTKQRRAYNEMKKDMVALVGENGDNILSAQDSLSRMMRLYQLSSAYVDVSAEGQVTLISPSSKIDALLEIIEERDGNPLVVFADLRKLIDLTAKTLAKKKIPYLKIVGGMGADEKFQTIERFQEGKTPVILCSIKAIKEGSTLTAADTAVFMQRSWSPIDNSQAEDRIHRIGAEVHDHVEIIDLVARNTIEVHQREALKRGYSTLAEVVRDPELAREILGMVK